MSERLHEIIAEVAMLHSHFENENILHNLEKIQEKLENVPSDVSEHYYKLLMQYYFQTNDLENLQQLLLEGIRFDMRFEDIKEAFIHIKDEKSVIEFLEENVVFLKDEILEEHLQEMYEYYHAHPELESVLNDSLELIKKNRYVCAKAFKSELEYCKFFINKDLLESLQNDMPFLFR